MRKLCTAVALAALAAACGPKKTMTLPTVQPPVAAKKPYVVKAPFGAERQDEYYWLRDRENEEVLAYLRAENAYTDTMLSPVKELREQLFTEMKARIKEDDNGVPVKMGTAWYNFKFEKGNEYPIHTRQKTEGGAEEVIFDENKMAKDLPYFDMSGYELSDDGRYAAYGIDLVSRRLYTLKVRDLQTGQDLPLEIKNTEGGSYAWSADGKHLFYTNKDTTTLLGYQIKRHEMGTDPSQDKVVYEEKDHSYYIGVGRTKSKKYIEISSGQNGVATEQFFLDAANPTGAFVSFAGRQVGHEFHVAHAGDRFYITTNLGGARNYKVMEAPDQLPAPTSTWKEVIPHREDVFVEGVDPFVGNLVIAERKEGLLQIRIRDRKTNQEHYLPFGEPAYTAYASNNPEYDATTLRYNYTSLTTPNSIYDYDMATRKATLRKQQTVLGSFNKDNYVTERVYAKARDGVMVPISLVYRKGYKKDGTEPLLQYAYGSYGNNLDVWFSSARLSLLDRGFGFAICHIRGGQEMGRHWYDDGKMLKKKNTFNDFIDCGQFLKDTKFVAGDKLFAMGGSAGGLLMGAVANMAGMNYRGIVAQVPFVDVVTTMLDSTIPLTTNEYEEWGNPAKKEYYDYMLSYSPYDNVEAKAYPNMLVTTGLHDSQVQYWEPAKWVARLRAKKTDKNLLLLHTDMEAGHGGASGRFKALHEVAREYAFMIECLDLPVDGVVKDVAK